MATLTKAVTTLATAPTLPLIRYYHHHHYPLHYNHHNNQEIIIRIIFFFIRPMQLFVLALSSMTLIKKPKMWRNLLYARLLAEQWCIDTVSGHFSGPRFLAFLVHVPFFLTNVPERANRTRARVRAREIKALPLERKTLLVGKSPLPTMVDNLGPT